MLQYFSLCFTDFWKNVLKGIFANILYSLVLAIIVLFFGRVVFQDENAFPVYWKWSYIGMLVLDGIIFLYKSFTTWPLIKALSVGWNSSIKEVYTLLIREKLGKGKKPEELLNWSAEDFRINASIHRLVKNALS